MDWEEVSAIGQMLGSVAVFITLVYLTLQVRHARQETQRSISLSRSEAVRENMATMATDARLLGAFQRAEAAMGEYRPPFVTTLMEQSGLGKEDAGVLFYWNISMFQTFQQSVRTVDALPAGERLAGDRALRSYYGMNPIGRLFYQSTRATADQDVVRYIDNVLAQPG